MERLESELGQTPGTGKLQRISQSQQMLSPLVL